MWFTIKHVKHAKHASDEELVQLTDGELNRIHAMRVNAHLSACWQCRIRRNEIEGAVTEFMKIRDTAAEPGNADASLRRLASKLASLQSDTANQSRPVRWMPSLRRYGFASVLLVVCVLAALWIRHEMMFTTITTSMPDSRLTPGMVRRVTASELCAAGRLDQRPLVSERTALRVFESYGIHEPGPRSYEVDYLITPDLGGSDDIDNLWPQRYSDGVWNSHVKDALEDRLHDLVCGGQLDLATAQRDIAANWIAAYKKYFHSDRPLELHASFVKDSPWP